MLRYRFPLGVLMILAAVAVLGLDGRFAPHYPLLFLASVTLVWICASEMCALLAPLPLKIHNRRFVRWGCTLIAIGNWLPAYSPAWLQLEAPTIKGPLAVYVAVGLIAFMRVAYYYREPGDAILRIAGYLLIFFYVGVLSAFLFQLRWLDPTLPAAGATALLLAVFTPKMGDTGAYFVGRFFGRTKFAPRLSPGKTIEGALGGFAGAILTAYLIGTFPIPGGAGRTLLSPGGAIAFGFVVGLFGMIGDLVESLMKRDAQIKDAANSIPGFGGLLDVVDSILFSAPFSYLLLVGLRAWPAS